MWFFRFNSQKLLIEFFSWRTNECTKRFSQEIKSYFHRKFLYIHRRKQRYCTTFLICSELTPWLYWEYTIQIFYVFMLMFSNIWKNMTIIFFIIQINYLLIKVNTFKDITATMPINSLWQFLFKIKINFFLCKQCQNLICK